LFLISVLLFAIFINRYTTFGKLTKRRLFSQIFLFVMELL